MAQDIFIKFNGIKGESQNFTHQGESGVLNQDWAVGQTSGMYLGSDDTGKDKHVIH